MVPDAHAPGDSGEESHAYPPGGLVRLLPIVLPVFAAGALAGAGALSSALSSSWTGGALAGLAALLAAACVAEKFPVMIAGLSAGEVSLAASVIVGASILFGWAPAVLLAAASRALVDLARQRPTLKLAFNSATYALAAAACGGVGVVVGRGGSVHATILDAFGGGLAFYATNLLLTMAVIGRASGEPLLPLLRQSFGATALPFAIMGSVSLMLVVLWSDWPGLSAALIGPFLSISLYQRSINGRLEALRLALTDPVTGLGNHRDFHEQLEERLRDSERASTPFTLCLLDLDNFKEINDQFGHPAGDRALVQLAARLRDVGTAFRIGGDEFAVFLPDVGAHNALEAAQHVVDRVRNAGDLVSVSAGVASYPRHATERAALVAAADDALYCAKRLGKDQVQVYRSADALPPPHPTRVAATPKTSAALTAIPS
jgi:diguanylate cyclase (GGDEF)-like protein